MLTPAFRETLKNPPKMYRPIPFWSWNERLRVEETRRQIADMDRVGIGGYFMHARGGLQTAYMGPEWMANIAAGIEEAESRGMGAWAYDENGWPSGFGDGRVNGRGLAYQQKYLRWHDVADTDSSSDDHVITDVRCADGRLLRFTFDVNPFYVDTLDAGVVRAFLEEIYEPYAERFGDALGASMPGFFTDEPQVSRNGIPWSFKLPEAYSEAWDEDLLALLPGLFLQEGQWRRTRYRFWHTVQELFVTAFTQQIYDWCEAHGCALTGHMVLEETLHSQITSNAAVMPHYEFFHVPGMDWLGRHINPPTTPLQVASVAHQTGRRQILSETFALTGWNVSFDELKWMFEWQMVRGVTLLCQHLEGYSLRGIRKRDYPPSLFYQQPWWEDYHIFNDAVSRVGMLLSRGQAQFDVLVIHPQSSAWLDFDNASNSGLDDRFRFFLSLTSALEGAHIPFDYGDERILRRHGSVEDNRLRVGACAYRAVIVPAALTLSHSTAALLLSFAEAGGDVLWCGAPPELIDGAAHAMVADLQKIGVLAMTPEATVDALPEDIRRIRIQDQETGSEVDAITVTERHLEAGDTGDGPLRLLYAVNSDRTVAHPTRLRIPGRSSCRLELISGDPEPIVYRRQGAELVLDWTFPPGGSLLLLVSDEDERFPAAPSAPPELSPLTSAELDGPWELELCDPNALTLDRCDVSFDGDWILENEHISVVQKRALELERPVDIVLRFRVEAAADWTVPDDCYLVLECPERFTLHINGKPVTGADAGYYRDMSFRKLPVSDLLCSGTNEILMATHFEQSPAVYENLRRARRFEAERNKLTYDSEIEAVYLIGSFGVATPGAFETLPRTAMRYDGGFVLTAPPTQVMPRNLTPQGLPFFNGTVRLRKSVHLTEPETRRRSLEFGGVEGHVLAAEVNGTRLGKWLWGPYATSLDGLLQPGENEMVLTLTGGLRNLLGPHHLAEGESYAVAPACFFKEAGIWGTRPWDSRYCFVDFGVEF